MKSDSLIWVRDKTGARHLCSMDDVGDANLVRGDEIGKCLDHDDRLETRGYVPSNDPQGKIRFAKSVSLN
jgi:hypothetical protein